MRPVRSVGLLGGSFNPAHGGHRRLSLRAMAVLRLDAVWWLVSPQNPLKPRAGMASLPARLARARAVARHPRIRVTDIESRMGTVRSVDTLAALRRRHPRVRFVWLMGADNLAQFHRWARWRALARLAPIVVVARPRYVGAGQTAPATSWLRRWRRRSAATWKHWRPPALLVLNLGLDARSATAIRHRSPDWAAPKEPAA